MKLCNAPERKRERQLNVLERLYATLSTKSYRRRLPSATEENKHRVEKEIKVLEGRTASNQRGIRTKKSRSA